jgi:hypothetical protein
VKKERNGYGSLILQAKELNHDRIVIGIPTTGLVRFEWVVARFGQIIPCNWSHAECHEWLRSDSPIGFSVAEARNVIVDKFIKSKGEWLLFIDHDVILPPDAFVKINQYMIDRTAPVISGLYFAKASPPEPLIYRGRGNGYFGDFALGSKVWVDGIPMGCTLIHRSVLEPMWNDAGEYRAQNTVVVRRVFDSPAGIIYDPQTGIHGYSGTEDLAWCNRVIAGKYLAKSDWPEFAKKKYPFLMDTSIFCRHITNDGVTYPLPQDLATWKTRRPK